MLYTFIITAEQKPPSRPQMGNPKPNNGRQDFLEMDDFEDFNL